MKISDLMFSQRFGRRPIMGISFFIITLASFICAFAPHEELSFEISYGLFAFGRFLLACATRGVALTGFVIGMYSNIINSYIYRSLCRPRNR